MIRYVEIYGEAKIVPNSKESQLRALLNPGIARFFKELESLNSVTIDKYPDGSLDIRIWDQFHNFAVDIPKGFEMFIDANYSVVGTFEAYTPDEAYPFSLIVTQGDTVEVGVPRMLDGEEFLNIIESKTGVDCDPYVDIQLAIRTGDPSVERMVFDAIVAPFEDCKQEPSGHYTTKINASIDFVEQLARELKAHKKHITDCIVEISHADCYLYYEHHGKRDYCLGLDFADYR